MIERIAADTGRRDAAADDAVLLENFHEEAGTAKRARARQAREPSADDGRFVCHLVPLLSIASNCSASERCQNRKIIEKLRNTL